MEDEITPAPAETTETIASATSDAPVVDAAAASATTDVASAAPDTTLTPADDAAAVETEPVVPADPPDTNDAADASDTDQTATGTVPLKRLQGVQRQLAQAERDRDAAQATIADLTAQVAAAQQTAAESHIAELRATLTDIVPDLIAGSTIDEVNTSLTASRAAYVAASKTIADQLADTARHTNSAPTSPSQPVDLARTDTQQLLQSGMRNADKRPSLNGLTPNPRH